MTRSPVVVIGAGPSGIAAALAASRSAPTMLLDEQAEPGGHLRWWPSDRDTQSHVTTSQLLIDAGVDYRPETAVWALFDGPSVAAYSGSRALSIDASAVIVATGSIDRAWPIPGWHLQGVSTPEPILRELQEGTVTPHIRFGVVGDGRFAGTVIAAIEDAGSTVAAHATDIANSRIEGDRKVAEFRDGSRSVAVDRVVLALGRRPDPALALTLRPQSAFARSALLEMPLLDINGATSVPGVYVTGEAAVFSDLTSGREHGARAGRAAATGAACGEFVAPPVTRSPALPLPTDPETIVCRQQMIDLQTIEAAIKHGAYDVNDLRRQTRAGMGLDGGHDTLAALAAMLLRHDPDIDDDRLIARVRPPVRPLPFRAVPGIAAD